MTPEQRDRKNAADKARRLKLKELGVSRLAEARPIESGGLVAPTAPSTVAEVIEAKAKATAPKKTVARKVKVLAPPKPKARPAPTGVRMQVITFKGSTEHHKAFMAAGGGAWLRGVLDRRMKGGK